jgi:hypothetical protein
MEFLSNSYASINRCLFSTLVAANNWYSKNRLLSVSLLLNILLGISFFLYLGYFGPLGLGNFEIPILCGLKYYLPELYKPVDSVKLLERGTCSGPALELGTNPSLGLRSESESLNSHIDNDLEKSDSPEKLRARRRDAIVLLVIAIGLTFYSLDLDIWYY